MSLEESLVQLPDFVVEEISSQQAIVIRVRYIGSIRCPACDGTALLLKDSWTRRVRHHPIGDKLTVLEFPTGKYRCLCGRHFHPRYPGILAYQRSTESFRTHMGKKHHEGLCQSVLGRPLSMSWATVERYWRRHSSRQARSSRPPWSYTPTGRRSLRRSLVVEVSRPSSAARRKSAELRTS